MYHLVDRAFRIVLLSLSIGAGALFAGAGIAQALPVSTTIAALSVCAFVVFDAGAGWVWRTKA